VSKNEPSDSARYQTLLQLLRATEAVWSASRIFFSRWNLSPSQFNVLNLLHCHSGLNQIELSRHLITHRSNVTGLVDRLEKRGLVARKPVPTDRRAHHVTLTSNGQRLLEAILPEYRQRTEEALGRIPLRQLSLLRQQLKTIEDTMGIYAASQSNE